MSEPVIDIRGLVTKFGSNVVHQDIDLAVPRGEVVALVGGSGSGKTLPPAPTAGKSGWHLLDG